MSRRLTIVAAAATLVASPALAQPAPASHTEMRHDLAELPGNAQDLMAQGSRLLGMANYPEGLRLITRATELEPGNGLAWAHLGLALVYNNRLAEADAALTKAVALEGRIGAVHRVLGLLAERRGDPVAAIELYDKALELDPDDAFAWGHRALANIELSKPYETLADFAEALKRGAPYPEIYSARVFALASLGRRAEAEAEIEAMVAANHEHPFALTTAAGLYTVFGFTEKARVAVERAEIGPSNALVLYSRAQARAPSDVEGQLADLDEALRLAPDSLPVVQRRATLRYQMGDTDGALADISRAIALSPKEPGLYLQQANIARAGGRTETALAAAEALTAANPESSYAHVAAGKIYSAYGQRERALAAIDRAIALGPLPYLYINRADVQDPADVAARLADIDQALHLAPNFWAGLVGKADLLIESANPAAAVTLYTQALEILHDDPGLLTKRAIALSRVGQQDEAERDFAQARTLATDAAMLNNICYDKAKAAVALERALGECDESLRLSPDNPAALDSRALVLLQMGRLDEAIAGFDRALGLSPRTAPSLFGRAVAWSRKGDQAKARADEQAALAIDPDIAARMGRFGLVVDGAQAP